MAACAVESVCYENEVEWPRATERCADLVWHFPYIASERNATNRKLYKRTHADLFGHARDCGARESHKSHWFMCIWRASSWNHSCLSLFFHVYLLIILRCLDSRPTCNTLDFCYFTFFLLGDWVGPETWLKRKNKSKGTKKCSVSFWLLYKSSTKCQPNQFFFVNRFAHIRCSRLSTAAHVQHVIQSIIHNLSVKCRKQ